MYPFDDEEEKIVKDAPAAVSPGISTEQRQQLYDYLLNKNDKEIKDVSDKAERNKGILSLAEAFEGGVRARGRARGGEGVDSSFYKGLSDDESKKVDQAKQVQGTKIQNLLKADQLSYQDKQNARQEEAFGRDKAIRDREDDPTSEESRTAQALASKMMPGKNFSRASATQLKQALPSLEKMYSIDQRKLERQDARQEAQLRRDTLNEEKLTKLSTPYGLANTDDDAKKLKEAHESKKSFDSKIDELIRLREDKGAELLDREAVGRARLLSKDLLLEYKNMAKLGVLSQADEAIINAIIPSDPLELKPFESVTGQDSILNNLKKFQQDSDRDFSERVKTRTRNGSASPITQEDKKESATKKPAWAK